MKYISRLRAKSEMGWLILTPVLVITVLFGMVFTQSVAAQNTLPLVAIHDSEYTRALENMPATGATPTGAGFTGKQWWFKDWRYHVFPEMIQEALRSDGTAFTVVGDSNIIAGALLTNGQPRYPIVISLGAEAIHDDQIAQFTNYVAAGGFLFVSASGFTRNTNGTTRGDFAFADAMGIHMANASLTNFELNTKYTRVGNHRLNEHFPAGTLNLRQPADSEEIPYGYTVNPAFPHDDNQAQAAHDFWQVTNSAATVIAQGATRPFLTVRQYGSGYIIYCAALQPLLGNGGWAPTMYNYLTFRRSIEWAFETANLPIGKLSAWPYPYDAAFMVRHDLEAFSNRIATVEASARFEYTNGCAGDYYFCTGTLREDMSPVYNTNDVLAGFYRAITNYGATIAPHNGGLTNARAAMTPAAYDYWHWGPDEILDITPAGYPSGSNYAYLSIAKSFDDVEAWLPGLVTNTMRMWCAPYYNGTREGSLNIQESLGVKITGEQKVAPFPHWSISTQVPGKRFSVLQQPPSDWYVGANISHSLEAGQTISSLRSAIDFYYNLGALVNFYSHSMSDGSLGNAAAQMRENVLYSMNTNRFPRLWSANAVKIYNWWLQRSNVQITVTHSTTGLVSLANFKIANATDTNTTIELVTPATTLFCDLKVYTNGVLAGTNIYRTTTQNIKVRVGNTVTNALLTYYPFAPSAPIYSENFDAVTAPAIPGVWSTAATGADTTWISQTNVADGSPNAAFAAGANGTGSSDLTSPSYALPTGPLQLSFRHNYDLEANVGTVGLDGGVVEIKIGTNVFTDIITAGGSFASGGYNYTVSSSFGNPLAGRQAWSGSSGGFVTTTINLPTSAAGQNVQFRWRIGSDSGNASVGWYVDTINVNGRACLCCSGGTNAPVLPNQTNRTVIELNSLIVTNAATDADLPSDAFYYAFASAPAGAIISPAGVITWTPTEAQGPSTNSFITIATDSTGRTATNTFVVTVLETNAAPVFVATPTNRTINEFTAVVVTNDATDSDLPTNSLSYSLLVAPVGASISASGVITWTPDETQGPSFNVFTTRVVDNGSPNLSATNSFSITVNEVNSAPIFPSPSDRTINEETLMIVTNAATDGDMPFNAITYQLLTAPSGATFNTNTGVITWAPSNLQGPSTNLFRTVATDNGVPPLSTTNTFNVIVNNSIICGFTNKMFQNFDTNTPPALPTGWTTAATGGQSVWTNQSIVSDSATNAVFTPDSGAVGTADLLSPIVALSTNAQAILSFRHSYDMEADAAPVGYDGGVLEIQIGTNVFQDIITAGGSFQAGPYNRTIASGFNSPIAGRQAWSANSGGFVTTTVALPAAAAGQNIQLRWRGASDDSTSATGWYVDSIVLSNYVCVSVAANSAPSLPVQTNRNVAEGSLLSVTNTASDADLPADTLIYSLVNPPSGLTISTNGIIAWTPSESQGPGTYTNTTIVTDAGGLSATNSFVITVSEVNQAPVLPVQTNRTIAELTLLTVTNTATDGDLPANALTYQLINPPSGASINASGVITWTPSEAQGPGTYTNTTVVNDGTVSVTNSFVVTVTEVNQAPVLPAQTNRTMTELTLLIVTNTATDGDLPANTLTYQLINPPSGVSINASGVITWTPSEAQGPGTYTNTTVVSDGTVSVTNSFTVTVMEVNQAPVLPAQTNRTMAELTLLTVTNTATDGDLPANALTYQLINPPSGASINASGVITWTPSEAQGPGTYTNMTVVSDGTVSVTNSFVVTVTEVNQAPVLPAQTNQTMAELTLLVVTNTATDGDFPANALSYQLITAPVGMSITASGVISWTPGEADGPSTNTVTTVVNDGTVSVTNSFLVMVTEANTAPTLSAISSRTVHAGSTVSFTAVGADTDTPVQQLSYSLLNAPPVGASINSSSGLFEWMTSGGDVNTTNTITVQVADDGVPGLSDAKGFVVTVIGRPQITEITVTNGVAAVTWSSIAGQAYRLQRTESLTPASWQDVDNDVIASGSSTSQTNAILGVDVRFYRVRLAP